MFFFSSDTTCPLRLRGLPPNATTCPLRLRGLPPNATTCPLRLRGLPLPPAVAEV